MSPAGRHRSPRRAPREPGVPTRRGGPGAARSFAAGAAAAGGRLGDHVDALRYRYGARFWVVLGASAALVSVAAVTLVVHVQTPPAPRVAPVVVTASGAPEPEVAPIVGSVDPKRNARICSDAANELVALAQRYPRYVDVAAADRARTEVLLTAVGTICDPDTARRTSERLGPWLGTARS